MGILKERKFNQNQLGLIHSHTLSLEKLKEKYPVLNNTDLVIEGGVGHWNNFPALRQIAINAFPNALYLGMDLNASWYRDIDRYLLKESLGIVSEEVVKRVKRADQLSDNVNDFTILANCWDYPLVRDIMDKTKTRKPILVSIASLLYLLGTRTTNYQEKDQDEFYSIAKLFENCPYSAHIHFNTEHYGVNPFVYGWRQYFQNTLILPAWYRWKAKFAGWELTNMRSDWGNNLALVNCFKNNKLII